MARESEYTELQECLRAVTWSTLKAYAGMLLGSRGYTRETQELLFRGVAAALLAYAIAYDMHLPWVSGLASQRAMADLAVTKRVAMTLAFPASLVARTLYLQHLARRVGGDAARRVGSLLGKLYMLFVRCTERGASGSPGYAPLERQYMEELSRAEGEVLRLVVAKHGGSISKLESIPTLTRDFIYALAEWYSGRGTHRLEKLLSEAGVPPEKLPAAVKELTERLSCLEYPALCVVLGALGDELAARGGELGSRIALSVGDLRGVVANNLAYTLAVLLPARPETAHEAARAVIEECVGVCNDKEWAENRVGCLDKAEECARSVLRRVLSGRVRLPPRTLDEAARAATLAIEAVAVYSGTWSLPMDAPAQTTTSLIERMAEWLCNPRLLDIAFIDAYTADLVRIAYTRSGVKLRPRVKQLEDFAAALHEAALMYCSSGERGKRRMPDVTGLARRLEQLVYTLEVQVHTLGLSSRLAEETIAKRFYVPT